MFNRVLKFFQIGRQVADRKKPNAIGAIFMPGKRGFGMPGIRPSTSSDEAKLECGMRKGEVGMRKVECNEKRTEEPGKSEP